MFSLTLDRILSSLVTLIVGIFELLIVAAFAVALVIWMATLFNVVVW